MQKENNRTKSRRALGEAAERAAACWLAGQGYEILERNVRCPFGEIDLIARESGELVFIEVRSRRREDWGLPEESVDQAKQRRLRRLGAWYLQRKEWSQTACRFDVVGVLRKMDAEKGEESWDFHLYQNAF